MQGRKCEPSRVCKRIAAYALTSFAGGQPRQMAASPAPEHPHRDVGCKGARNPWRHLPPGAARSPHVEAGAQLQVARRHAEQ